MQRVCFAHYFSLFSALLLIPASSSVCAEIALPQPSHSFETLSLADCKRIAFLRNWDLLAAEANLDQGVAQRLVAHEFPNPTLSYSTSKLNVDKHPNSTSAGNGLWTRGYDTIFAVSQLVEIGGKRSDRQASANAGVKAAEAAFSDAHRQLDLGVTKAYIAALLAQENARILNQSASALRRQAKIAEVRLRAGDISRSDKAQIEINEEQFELNAAAAESTAVGNRISVEVLLGVEKPLGQWKAGDSLESLARIRTGTPADTANAESRRPDLVAAEASLQKSIFDLKLQEAMRIPDPTFLVQYEHQPPDTPNTIGFGVSLPLPLWNHNEGNIKAAQAARDQAAAALGKVRTQIDADITTAMAAYAEAANRSRRYESDIVPKSKAVTEAISYSYQKGSASLVDLLNAERIDNDVRVAAVQALADAATAAAALAIARNVEPAIRARPTKTHDVAH